MESAPIEKQPEILYHYTTMSTLYALLNNLVKDETTGDYRLNFWASHILYMNDPHEFYFYQNCLQEALARYEEKNGLVNKSYIFGDKNIVTLGFDQYPYIFSLSEIKDDLSMWRAYGGNGCGVAIGFKTDRLINDLKNEFHVLGQYSSASLEKIEYHKKEDLINSMLNDEEFINDIYSQIKITNGKWSLNFNVLILLLLNMPCKKNSAYSAEKEWRIRTSNRMNNFREKNGSIIPYNIIPIPLAAIDNIIIGPCTDKSRAANSLMGMLIKAVGSEMAKNTKIMISNVPYIIQ